MKVNVVPERALPEKWVDNRTLPRMTDEEIMYDREDLNLFYRRKYFVAINDRMRDPNAYNLAADRIVCNTMEHRNEMYRKLREEEHEAMAETFQKLQEEKFLENEERTRNDQPNNGTDNIELGNLAAPTNSSRISASDGTVLRLPPANSAGTSTGQYSRDESLASDEEQLRPAGGTGCPKPKRG